MSTATCFTAAPKEPAARTVPRFAHLRAGLLALASGGAILGVCVPMPAAAASAAAAPASAAATAPATSFYANFKGAKLLSQEGQPVQPDQLLGHLVLINFVYTGCSTVCPVQTRALADLQGRLPRALRARVRFLSISLDPLSDSPKVLKAFAQRMGADLSGWTFATGRPEDIERVSDALRLYRPGANVRKPEEHNTALWLVDAQGQLRMRYNGNPPDIERLLRELTELDRLGHPAG